MPRRKEPRIPDAVLDQLLAGADAKTAFDPNGLIDDLKKALAERVLNAEMDHHLAGEEPGNRRNGYGKKTVITDTGQIELEVPRDRQARFDPQLIAKYQRRFPGFDDKIISMYARGMSTREIVGHLRDLYGIDVSPDLISAVTDAVLEEVSAWQARPLEEIYPLVFLMRYGSRSATKGWCATRRSTSRLASAPTAPRRSWAFGSSKMRAPNSGYAS
jgi:putative transposase